MDSFAHQAGMQETAIAELAPRRLRLSGGVLGVFASQSLDSPRLDRTHAIVVVHGALRNAGDYFRAIQAADRQGSGTLIVAPQFLTERDIEGHTARNGLLRWATEDWKGGLGEVSSFAVMDELLSIVCRFPGLRQVTLVGNSAGGQFVNRYAAVGRFLSTDVPVRYVVSNPSTYLYFDRQRPAEAGFVERLDPELDRWRYGFGSGLPNYVDRTPESYFEQYINQDVTYLLGADDDDPEAVLLEVHPAAMAQGPTRRKRGELYHAYLAIKANRPVHRLVRVPSVGHDAPALYSSPEGRACLFGTDR